MIDHVSLHVSDLAAAKAFYTAALAPLKYTVLAEYPGVIGMGADGKPDVWIDQVEGKITPTHLAIRAVDQATVGAFHAAALAAGGKDNGAPGPRPEYSPTYYGAFIHDADGNNVEAVHHG